MIVRSLAKTNRRRGFTLVELLITISIIGIMASMVMFAMFSAQEAAREQKTRALIAKLNNIIMQRYESYRTRRVPIAFTDAERAQPKLMAAMRLEALHDLMRMEMPDRWSDVVEKPKAPLSGTPGTLQPPSAYVSFRRKYGVMTNQLLASDPITNPIMNLAAFQDMQGAECLYMIVMDTLAQEGDSRDVFKSNDIGDFDNDKFPEFHDAWGRPIRFLRWAPGFDSPTQTVGKLSPSTDSTPGQSVIVRFPAAYFSPSGNYLGGVLAVVEPGTEQFNTTRMGQITDYEHTGAGGEAIFTCKTPSGETPPFSGGVPTRTSSVALLGPDPFDSRAIYPDYAFDDTSTPSYNLVPLIYSGGSDRAFGIAAEMDGVLSYSAHRLYPCYVPAPGSGDPFGKMMGTKVKAKEEPENGWLDNITSHDLNRR